MSNHVIYVYGTLRPGNSETFEVPGHLYDLGWYPGIELASPDKTESRVICEKIVVDDDKLRSLDRYEGYIDWDPENSLYLRVPYLDGEIYVYNNSFEGRLIVDGGDWLKYTDSKKGVAA